MNKNREIWKDIEGFKGYKVSNHGRVMATTERIYYCSQVRPQFFPTQILSEKGYLCVWLRIKRLKVHRLVAAAFVPNPENKQEVNHKNGNKLDNHWKNLEWVTRKENMDHAVKNNLIKRGPENGRAKLTMAQAEEIRASSGSLRKLAKRYGVGQNSIHRIKRGLAYINTN